jgi:molecular chaperone GrpE
MADEKTKNDRNDEAQEAAATNDAEEAAEAVEEAEALEDPAALISDLEEKLAEAEAKLAEVEAQAAEYKDGWQRTQASFANFRKRTEAERANWRSNANAQLLARLLPILDDFKRAFDAVPEAIEDNGWLDGIQLIRRKVRAILDTENVTPIELEPGDPFDPQYHEAVLHQEVEGFDDGEVVAVVESGYMLGNRVLRPAMVVVAKAPAKPASEEDADVVEADVVEAEVVQDEDIDGDTDEKASQDNNA